MSSRSRLIEIIEGDRPPINGETGQYQVNKGAIYLDTFEPAIWIQIGKQHDPKWIKMLSSYPPNGFYKVTNLYVDPATGKLTVEYDNEP